ncbi:MAG: 50S ribosomal protein L18 [Candidatus Aminicenantes bacterium]|nr:50S ribosomal protein L18 [Candidatus Aminicenantes bacterium]
MNRLLQKQKRLKKRIVRVRRSIISKHSRPRLVLNRSNKFLSCQVIDDLSGRTLCAASTMEKSYSGQKKNKEAALALGKLIAERGKAAGIKQIVFDRRGCLYHGNIKVFADSARESGLEF